MTRKIGIIAAGLFGAMFGALAALPTASAMPIAPAPATPDVAGVEQVRMVCDVWGRCWWRPNYYGYYGPGRITALDIMGRRAITGHAITARAITAIAAGNM